MRSLREQLDLWLVAAVSGPADEIGEFIHGAEYVVSLTFPFHDPDCFFELLLFACTVGDVGYHRAEIDFGEILFGKFENLTSEHASGLPVVCGNP